MNIYTEEPSNWKDLEEKTSKFLTELGYVCEIEKDIETVRGVVNVDVIAISKEVPNTIVICECKCWNNAIPQTVIHSFRTVINDYGANFGIIISKKGFQSGALEGVKNSTILLFTWSEFQDYFKSKWIKKKTVEISKITKPLYDYVSVGFKIFFKEEYNSLSAENLEVFEQLTQKHFDIAFYSSNHQYLSLETGEFDIDMFEMMFNAARKDFKKNFSSYEEYFEFLIKKSESGLKDFDKLFKKEVRKTNLI
jgi:hypothetical protein